VDASKIAGSTVRLTCRYSNGIVKNFVARAVSLEGQMLQVTCSEGFEPGIGLTVMAPFLTGGQTSLVTAVTRDAKVGLQIISLKLQPAPITLRVPVKAAKAVKPSSAAKAAFSRYANQLADKLAFAGKKPYRKAAFGKGVQHGFVAATAAAALLLLAEKKQLDAVAILDRLRKAR
jgi:hypothetical protein